jgi:PAS domain S-box-containing protein
VTENRSAGDSQKKSDQGAKAMGTPGLPRFAAIILVIAGLALSFLGFLTARGWEQSAIENDLKVIAQNRISALEGGITQNLLFLEILSDLSEYMPESIYGCFHSVTHVSRIEHDDIILIWVPHVISEGSSLYEDDDTTVAPIHEDNYPILYISSTQLYEHLIGFDLASDPVFAECFRRAAASGEVVISGELIHPNPFTDSVAVLFVMPVFTESPYSGLSSSTYSELGGYFICVNLMSELINQCLNPFVQQGVDMHLFDILPSGEEELLVYHASRTRTDHGERVEDISLLLSSTNYSEKIVFGDREWLIVFTPSSTFLAERHSIHPWVILISGIFFTGLLFAFIRGTYRSARISHQFAADQAAFSRELEKALEEQKSTAKKLSVSEQNFISLIEQSPDGIVISDSDGKHLFTNKRMCEITGYDKKEQTSISIEEMIHPEVLNNHRELYARQMREEETLDQFESAIVRKDGKVIPIELRATTTLWKGKTCELIFITDISERIKLKERLFQSQKLETVGLLAGGIAHDFNNILQTIFGYVELVGMNFSDGDIALGDIAEIKKGARRAAALTAQLLAFSRQQTLAPRNIDINDLTTRLIKMLRRIIGEDIKLEFIPGQGLSTVFVDPGQMEQILMNLCNNSRDAMPHGGHLTFETESVLITKDYSDTHPDVEQGNYVLITVTDSGCGMNEEILSKAFEPFFTTKEVGKGSGLGLATVFGIVKQHNGFINAYSEVDKGTSIKIYLPLVECPPEEINNKIQREVVGGTETILVAEDEEEVRVIAARILRRAGYTVLEASDGVEAIELINENPDSISLALLDVVMPEKSGQDVYRMIQETAPNIRTLFTSGYSANAIHTRFILHDGMILLRKPYAPDVLLREIRTILDE